MAYIQGSYPILKKQELQKGIFDCTVSCPEIASQAQAGQFVHIRVDGFMLRRPVSICEIYREDGAVRLVFEVRGEGTAKLAELPEGGRMDLLGPLGNGFRLFAPEKKVILVGGGIGVPPLLQVAAHYGAHATAILGFRSADRIILARDFEASGADLRLATDDGSQGHHGFVTELLESRLIEGPAEAICACGPMAMLRGVVALAERFGIPSQVSLEERMGCGIGACLVCACKTVKDGREIYSHVCKDGPVFDGKSVVFE